MKQSIIYLGIALVTFTNVISALGQQSFIIGDSVAQTTQAKTSLAVNNANSNSRRNASELADPDMVTIVAAPYEKTMEEIIAENNQIIESSLALESSAENTNEGENQVDVSIEGSTFENQTVTEERILQDSQIIESPIFTESLPLASGKPKKS